MDNPELYGVVYLSSSPVAAVAEAFGHRSIWLESMFRPRPGVVKAIAEFELSLDKIVNLDNARVLASQRLKPSEVITRNRHITQAWAARLFAMKRWTGVSWWSYYEAEWSSVGIWSMRALIPTSNISILSRKHPAVEEATEVLNRVWSDEAV
ncbi:MAG: RES family NAD+ phosphorylase [Actinomycetota bacterium]